MGSAIRPIAVCVFSRGGRILVHEVEDAEKGERFCRPIGGGIEFGETAEEAMKREAREELGLEVGSLRLLGVLENRFDFRGERRHEIVFVFDGEFSDGSVYSRKSLHVADTAGSYDAVWKEMSDFGDGKEIMYPTGIMGLVKDLR